MKRCKRKNTINVFNEGGQAKGGFNMQSMAGGAAGMFSSLGTMVNGDKNSYELAAYGDATQDPTMRMIGDITGANTKNAIKDIEAKANQYNYVDNNQDLLSSYDNLGLIDNIEDKNLSWSDVGDNLLASGQGAAQGMQYGGAYGALIGGIVGGVNNVVSLFGRDKRTEKINDAIDKANQRKLANFQNNASNISQQNNLNMLANYSANGGYTNTSKKAFKKVKKLENGGNLYLDIPNIGQHGGMFSNGVDYINAGGTHETNSYGGVQIGVDAEGIPNMVEEGEVRFNNYIFSDRNKVDKDLLLQYGLPESYSNKSFANIAKSVSKESDERPNDPISKRGLANSMIKLQQAQEDYKERNNKDNNQVMNIFDGGGIYNSISKYGNNNSIDPFKNLFKDWSLNTPVSKVETEKYNVLADNTKLTLDRPEITYGETLDIKNSSDNPSKEKFKLDASHLRYAPAVASGIQSLVDAFDSPDYANANMIGQAASQLPTASYNPLGDYLTYKPLDRQFYSNKLSEQAGATRRAITNLSGGNSSKAIGSLLAADYNAQSKMGDLLRSAEEYNNNQRERVASFNRGTNQANSQMDLQAQGMNMNRGNIILQAAMQEAAMREGIDNAFGASKAANLSNFINSLGDIGWEEYQKNQINDNRYLKYGTKSTGNSHYKKNG